MCRFCGMPNADHHFDMRTASAEAGSAVNGGGNVVAGALPSGAATEISFLNGLTSSGVIAGTSFWTWNYNNPATYSTTSWANKWGNPTPGTSGGTVTYWFDGSSSWTQTEKNALISGLALWSSVADINFSLASGAGTANFIFKRGTDDSAYETGPQTVTTVGSSALGTPLATGTLISIDTSVAGFGPIGAGFSQYGGYPYQTLVHEIGHLIGLGHGGAYNGNVNAATQQYSAYDTRLWTVMSYINPWTSSAKYYNSYPVTGTSWGVSPDGYYYSPTTPMMLDIAAAQQLYGKPTSGPFVSGTVVYGFNTNITGPVKAYFDFAVNTHPVITIWNGGTNNTLDLSGFTSASTVNLNAGTFSSVAGATNNIGIADDTVIETAIGGSGSDTITGNEYNNVLKGGAGSDMLAGGTGADTLTGGAGNDTLDGGADSDTAVYSGNLANYSIVHNADGTWTVTDLRNGSPDGGDTITNIETAQFADTSYALSGVVTVATPSMLLHPMSESGVLWDRVTNHQTLTFVGMAHSNNTIKIYDGDQLLGTTTTDPNVGGWTFTSPVLTDGVHSLTATATDENGNTSTACDAVVVTIDTVAPTTAIAAFSAAGVLSGTSEAGSTVKIYDGGVLAGSVIADASGAWSFGGISGVRHNYTAVATDVADNTGAPTPKFMVGTVGNDVFNVSPGADTMLGGAGNDKYWIDTLADKVVESPGEGKDWVYTTVSGYTLPDNIEVGAIGVTTGMTLNANPSNGGILFGNVGNDILNGGSANDQFAGSSGNDKIYGNAGNDAMSGDDGDDILDGGPGADNMLGGLGNDRYYVDNAGDKVVETAGAGKDWVYVTLDGYTLPDNVEVGYVFSTAGLTLSGNAGNNVLFGNTGNDTLNGGGGDDQFAANAGNDLLTGGTGNDLLTGGAGNDTFVFNLGDGLDTITDFDPVNDTLDLHGYAAVGATDFTSLMALATQVGNNTVLTFDANNVITLQNVQLSQLGAGDVLLG
ncbi:MAG: M10 family metallopeptidase C-terminal domain-containing protein [Hyphomicrobiales bacterium]|nr:M10 family metallopeptidase C-terminal domain-containing protein [Hyphomicrobiales bacterium]